MRERMTRQSHEENVGDDRKFILFWVVVTWQLTIVKIIKLANLKSVHLLNINYTFIKSQILAVDTDVLIT